LLQNLILHRQNISEKLHTNHNIFHRNQRTYGPMGCDGNRRVSWNSFSNLRTAVRKKFSLLQDVIFHTCRILAGWPLRNPVVASRSSRHQSQDRPIFCARSRSSLVLKPCTVFAVTESSPTYFRKIAYRPQESSIQARACMGCVRISMRLI